MRLALGPSKRLSCASAATGATAVGRPPAITTLLGMARAHASREKVSEHGDEWQPDQD